MEIRKDFLMKTGKKLRKCYTLRKKGKTDIIPRKSEKIFSIKKKYSDYIFNYLKNILVESKSLHPEENSSQGGSFYNSLTPSNIKKLQISEFFNTNKSTFSDISLPCLLYTSPSPRDLSTSRMPSSA